MVQLKEFRALRQQHFDTVLKLDSLAKKLLELETKDSVQFSSINAKNFINSNELVDGVKKTILIVTHHMLQENPFAGKKLRQACTRGCW